MDRARRAGWVDAEPTWTDTAKSFPAQRSRMLKALRSGADDEVWVAALPVLAANRRDMRAVVNRLADVGAAIIEGMSDFRSWPPHEAALMFANCWDVWSRQRKLLDDPKGGAELARKGGKPRRMPAAEARPIWFDPTLKSNAEALAKMNGDPCWRQPWTVVSAYRHFGKAGRPAGRRPKPCQCEPET